MFPSVSLQWLLSRCSRWHRQLRRVARRITRSCSTCSSTSLSCIVIISPARPIHDVSSQYIVILRPPPHGGLPTAHDADFIFMTIVLSHDMILEDAPRPSPPSTPPRAVFRFAVQRPVLATVSCRTEASGTIFPSLVWLLPALARRRAGPFDSGCVRACQGEDSQLSSGMLVQCCQSYRQFACRWARFIDS